MEGGMIDIALTSASLPAKHRILSVCVRLFLEKGYRHATLAEIIERSDVSYSTFQNIFRAKDGVLTELTEFMFSNQFSAAASVTGAPLTPVQLYAVETSLQLTLTELNENLREIYLEAPPRLPLLWGWISARWRSAFCTSFFRRSPCAMIFL